MHRHTYRDSEIEVYSGTQKDNREIYIEAEGESEKDRERAREKERGAGNQHYLAAGCPQELEGLDAHQ